MTNVIPFKGKEEKKSERKVLLDGASVWECPDCECSLFYVDIDFGIYCGACEEQMFAGEAIIDIELEDNNGSDDNS